MLGTIPGLAQYSTVVRSSQNWSHYYSLHICFLLTFWCSSFFLDLCIAHGDTLSYRDIIVVHLVPVLYMGDVTVYYTIHIYATML